MGFLGCGLGFGILYYGVGRLERGMERERGDYLLGW